MSVLLFIIGVYLFAGACYIRWFRVKHPGRLRRLKELQARFGTEKGDRMHFFLYVVLQTAVGLFLILRGAVRFGWI